MKIDSRVMEKYMDVVHNVWGKDAKMIDYCAKKVHQIVPISNDRYVVIEKPGKLETDFYFGYSVCGQGVDYDTMNKEMCDAEKKAVSYFIKENTRGFDFQINALKNGEFMFYNGGAYGNFGHLDYERYGELTPHSALTVEDTNAIIDALEREKADVIKRCNAYVKRYGTKKFGYHSYWIDE